MSSVHRGILPPYILEGIATHGTKPQRADALQALSHDHSLRAARMEGALLRPPRRRIPHAAAAPGTPSRTIRDARSGTDVTRAQVVRTEGGPATADAAADEAYDGLGATYDFYWSVFGRDSIDDQGLPLDGVVHYGSRYDNAFWDGQRMVFGDGDGTIFNRFTASLDVIGHELTHGVTDDEAGLRYFGQSGALNESVSDVFGSMVTQYARNEQAQDADWLIGADLLGDTINGTALRSMLNPGTAYDDPRLGGKDPQPAHFGDFVQTTSDNGGVHINSGIPNRAFAEAAVAIGGYAWEGAGRVWYEALRDPALRPTSSFTAFAQLTVRTAGRVFGAGSSEVTAVAAGWTAVGVPT
jgi:Zn-dependent metalloprotease